MKILIVDKDFPFPQNDGARIRSWNFIKALAGEHELSILCFNKYNSNSSNEASKYFAHIWIVDKGDNLQNRKYNRINRLLYFFQKIPWEMSQSFSESFQDKFIEIIKEHHFDTIFTRYLHMGQYVIRNSKLLNARTVLDLDDIEFIKVDRIIKTSKFRGIYSHLRMYLNNLLLKRYYRRINSFSNVIVCSENDGDYLEAEGFLKNDAVVIPNAVDVASYDSVNPFSYEVLRNKVLLFCGNLGYDPNSEGIMWFIKHVFPLIRQKDPDVKLHIVGLRPPSEVIEAHDNKQIFVFPNVPQVLPYYNGCSAAIVPIRIGGGTRIKILEAFSCRRPVISTTVGAEGLKVIDKKHCLIQDNPQDFASACLKVLNDYESAHKLVEEGYRLVRENYDKLHVTKLIRNLFNNTEWPCKYTS
jgi:glycosyltransferase involved in cell wall biosynthesis